MTRPRITRREELRFHAVYEPVGDAATVTRLEELFRSLNARHFGGRLTQPPLRLSARMRTRLAALTLHQLTGRPTLLTVSRRHVQRDGWREVARTLLHEMVHLWQYAEGLPIGHGPSFRRMALAVGVSPDAGRRVRPGPTR